MAKTTKYIYSFGGGSAEGRGGMQDLLGGKGAGLAEMSRLGIPVPPGFTLTTEACSYYHSNDGGFPAGLKSELAQHLEALQQVQGQGLGDPCKPLLLSVRSGAPISMPGMMDTVLNLGMTPEIVESASEQDAWFWRDCYRRLLTMYSDVVLELPSSDFERVLRTVLEEAGAKREQELSREAMDTWIERIERLIEQQNSAVPADPLDQLWGAVAAVFESWDNRRAREYRRIEGISESLGTGVTVQTMVFGNRGDDCGAGVAFSRNPATGKPGLFGEYLVNSQGEDVVAGSHTPRSIAPGPSSPGLAAEFPEAHGELERVCGVLERHFSEMQDLEFTIQHGQLYMLQTRAGKRSGPAAIRIAVDMEEERLISRREAIRRVEPQHVIQVMAPVFDPNEYRAATDAGKRIAHGLPAGPGAASGRIAFSAERAAEMAETGPVLLVRNETSPEDIVGMHASSGILTTRGGMTSHAAVVARGLGKPCVVGASDLVLDEKSRELRTSSQTLREGDHVSIDGTLGDVIAGALHPVPSAILDALVQSEVHSEAKSQAENRQPHSGRTSSIDGRAIECFRRLMKWCDDERRLKVRANADTPQDAAVAKRLGAEGIGLCRTEHMFFDEQRIPLVRRMILAANEKERTEALAGLMPLQQADFEGIFRALEGLPVTIRLLDPPLHEFLPHGEDAIERLAELSDLSADQLRDKAASLAEVNPMLGHRGCRVGLTTPAIYEMQVEAVARASCRVQSQGVEVRPEIMVPLTGVEEEMSRLRTLIERTLERVYSEEGCQVETLIGSMIEIPRAALIADRIALRSDFFSFGTNDLTQMTYGYSRDDVGRFLPFYVDEQIVPFDPFSQIDPDGVGELVRLAVERGRRAKPELKLGVCGEHGGDAESVAFFERCGLDYVSCSPYRLPIARLAAARACIVGSENGDGKGEGARGKGAAL